MRPKVDERSRSSLASPVRLGALWCVALILSACAGASKVPQIAVLHSHVDLSRHRNVQAAPLFYEGTYPGAAARAVQVLASELSKSGMLIVDPPARGEAADGRYPELAAPSDASAMVAEGRHQALLQGRVLVCNPYPPQALGFQIEIIALPSREVLFSAIGVFDASEQITIDDLQDYERRILAPAKVSYGFDGVLLSSERFAQYVGQRFARKLRESLGQR